MPLAPFVHRAVVGLPMESFPNRLDSTLNQLLGVSQQGRSTHPVDVREDADHLYVEAELPGYQKHEIEITLENSQLTIVAERKAASAPNPAAAHDPAAHDHAALPKPTEWLLSERRMRPFHRTFELPPTVDGSNVNASLADGILTVTLKKRLESKPRKISVG